MSARATASPRFAAPALVLAAAFALAPLVACESSGGDGGLSPITGVLVKSESLFATRGCGTAAREGFKYAAFVESQDDQVVAAGVYDCFADASFVNLPRSRTGSLTFDVYVLAFDAPSWEGEAGPVGAATSRADLGALLATRPTSSTRCRATQQQDVQVLAECDPLTDGARTDAEVELPTGLFEAVVQPVDGGAPDAAPEVTPVGCGTYVTVAVEGVPGAAPVEPLEVSCPSAWAVRATPGERYAVIARLKGPSGVNLGSTRCEAVAAAGRRTTLRCDLLPPVAVPL